MTAHELVHGLRWDLFLCQQGDESTEHPVIGDEYHRDVVTRQHLRPVNREHRLAGARRSHDEQRLVERRLIDIELILVARDLLVGR